MGFSSLRVDLAGMGDSPPRPGLTNRQSIAADFAEILSILDLRLGHLPIVLVGLCTGADNATSLALVEPRVIGLVLLDPICYPDHSLLGFKARMVIAKYTNPGRYARWVIRRLKALMQSGAAKPEVAKSVDPLALRDLPTREQLRAAFELIRERGGRVLCVFTEYARGYYNRSGQLGRTLGLPGYREFCTELFWPQTHHTYWLELHRRRLMEEIKLWAGNYVRS
jgi:pimeloyl-ACP methyl ester carboxylesterase